MKAACTLCFHHCLLEEGQTGFCHGRMNVDGKIKCINYGKITAAALDPIEKKPFRCFYPGSWIYSLGSFGCNLHCPFCQNSDISTVGLGRVKTYTIMPEDAVAEALDLKKEGNIGIAYTYNEPLISYEYLMDTTPLAHENGLKNVLVTNGTIEEAPLRNLLPYIDAMNIDLKGFTENFYKLLGGDLETVKRTIQISSEKCHVEVTTLVIPNGNDSDDEIRQIATFLANIDPDIPYHLSRFFPRWKMTDRSATNVNSVYHLADVAREKLKNVFTGNC